MTLESVSVIICGATGRLGNAVVKAFVSNSDTYAMRVVACVAPSVANGKTTRELPDGIPAFSSLSQAIEAVAEKDTVVIDLTHAEPAEKHLQISLDAKLNVVIGVTGFKDGVLEQWADKFSTIGKAILYVPNFSLGAVLMMRLATEIAPYMPNVEIIEIHHEAKRDAPSGTAKLTASRIEAINKGAEVPIHSLRLPGATAHQEVVFGSTGELLTVRHDAIDRSCYAAGVAMAAKKVSELQGLHIGLETAL